MTSDSPSPQRFVALDVHKHYLVVAAVDARQTVVLQPTRIGLAGIATWMTRHLRRSDAVVLEAGPNTWHIYDQLQPHVASVTVANPQQVKMIAAARVKTNARDALALAKLLAADFVPTVWVPPAEGRALRALVAHRTRLIRQRTQARNRLHSILHSHALVPPPGDPFAPEARPWWQSLTLPPVQRLCVLQDLALLDSLSPLIKEADAAILEQSMQAPWREQVPYLLQVRGVGVLTAMILLAAIGTITRFPSARHVVSYAGLATSVYDSGQTHRTGRITKQGRREMRAALVEAAWIAVRYDPYWKAQFERLCKRMPEGKAIVAIARKMLVVIWHLLTKQVADRRADGEAVARKFFQWAAALGSVGRENLSLAAFTRRELDRLGLAQDLTSVQAAGRRVGLPPLRALIPPS